ncbi:MAG: MarR family winged helix-turn-helix transcriptional regulator [Cellulomonadaceae bacterium]
MVDGQQDGTGAEFLALLHAALRAVRKEAAEDLAPLGLSPGQFRFLRVLERCDGPRRLSDVATALDVAPRSVTAKVDAAEAAGLVRRRPDPSDRRATLVELSDAGRTALGAARRARGVRAQSLLVDLDAAEQRELLRLLTKIAGTAG